MTTLADADAFAFELIQEFGTIGTYIKVTPGAYNPATATAGQTTASQPVNCVLLDYTLKRDGVAAKAGTDIIHADKQAYVIPPQKTGGTAVTPDPLNDKLEVGGVKFSIVGVQEINPTGEDPILYTFYLRR
jgi:hypothetical protein